MTSTSGEIWRKASASQDTNCVEISWKKSSFSAVAECVEVGSSTSQDRVFIRDTKNRSGGMLSVDGSTWQEFMLGIRSGRFSC